MTSELTEKVSPAPVETGLVGTPPVRTLTVEPLAEPPRPDHVRSHPKGCYWDFVDCRWRCSTA